MKFTGWSQGLRVTADGAGVVPLAGVAAVRLLADRVGLTVALSEAVRRRRFVPTHDRGQVLVDMAAVLVAGGEVIADIDTLRHQEPLLGRVASPATVWRTLDEVTPAALKRIATARARVRRHVWALLPNGVPAASVAGTDLGETVGLDVDATLVTAHSEKQGAAANFRGGFGFHPLGCGAITPVNSSRSSCVRATRTPTTLKTTSTCWVRRSPRSRPAADARC